jgi:hypothetical protein
MSKFVWYDLMTDNAEKATSCYKKDGRQPSD